MLTVQDTENMQLELLVAERIALAIKLLDESLDEDDYRARNTVKMARYQLRKLVNPPKRRAMRATLTCTPVQVKPE